MLRPNRYAVRLHEIPLAELAREGIRGLIVDLDNTLVAYRGSEIAREHIAWVAEAKAAGFSVVMLSNNFSDRVAKVAAQIGVPSVPSALKPLPFGFGRALRALGLPKREVAVVGDQLFTDVLGAKMLGLYTILTEPIEPHDFPLTRFTRFLERTLVGRRPR